LGDCTFEGETNAFCLSLNLKTHHADKLHVFQDLKSSDISAIAYGPYDNGYLLLGLKSGLLLGYDSIPGKKENFLEKMLSIDLKRGPIINLSFDPTSLIFVETHQDKETHLCAVSLMDNNVQYVYMEMGKAKFYTVRLDTNEKRKMKQI